MANKYIIQLGAVVFITLTAFQCEHDYPVVNYLEVPDDFNISVTPEKLEYTVGDTLWLSGEITEEDMLSGSGFEGLTNGTGVFIFQVFKLKKAYAYIDEGPSNFDLIYANGDTQEYDSTKFGSSAYGSVIRKTDMEYQNQTYSFTIGLIPKVVGDYSFYVGSAIVSYDKMPDAAYEFNILNHHFSVSNNNKKLIEGLGYSDKIYIGNSADNFTLPLDDSTKIFAFKVVD